MNDTHDDSKKVASMSELASKLNLSRWAVSRALNGRPGISKATAARVRAALKEHHFVPDPLARGLRGGATGMVAVCLPRGLLDASKSDCGGLHPHLAAAGLSLLLKRLEDNGLFGITITAEGAEQEIESLRRVLGLRVEAAVLVCPRYEARTLVNSRLTSSLPPCIAIDALHDLPCTSVRFDRHQAARLGMSHLQQSGHKRLVLLGTPPNSPSFKAYETAAPALGLAWRKDVRALHSDDLPTSSTHGVAYGWALADVLLRRKLGATGLIAADDYIAFGALSRLQREGKNVPHDFALIGHGNLPLAGFSDPPLSTVDPQVSRMFELAADTLCEQVRAAGQIETQEILINPVFLKRASTGPPNKNQSVEDGAAGQS